jgi:Na+-transporting NADH:ubiquinone oxidoreductase subunit D
MSLKKLLGAPAHKTIMDGLWNDHPVSSMCLGICSALAITNKLENAIAMGVGTAFVLVATALFISVLRKLIPLRVRILTYMIVIATFVIVVDRSLKAFYPDISEAVGPYVGLIITNCIIMGRAEAFYSQNGVGLSILDAVANGISYSYALLAIAAVREILAFGTFLDIKVTPDSWENCVVMALAPGAFFLLGIFLWISRTAADVEPPKGA